MSGERTYYDQIKNLLLNKKIFAFLVIICVAVIGFASVTDSVHRIGQFIGIFSSAPNLTIVDVDDSQANSVEFKLKNSGNDSAFLTKIEFILGKGTKGCDGCAPQLAFEYRVEASVKSETIIMAATYRDRLTLETLSAPLYPEIPTAGISSEERQKIFDQRYQMRMNFREKAELTIGTPSKPIRISQSVPPKGVDSFRIKFNVDNLGEHGYYIFPATAVIHFDGSEQIITPPFDIYLRHCEPNDLLSNPRCPRG